MRSMDKAIANMGSRFIGDPLRVIRLTDRITKPVGSVRATLKKGLTGNGTKS